MSKDRVYDKGERRRKHVGSGDEPTFQLELGNPRKVVGKCPSTVPEIERDRLLNKAIPLDDDDRELGPPKKIYAVYQGAIYEAQTSDHGRTYHAYPFKGKLTNGIIGLLTKMADDEDCRDGFDLWMKLYIVRHGR